MGDQGGGTALERIGEVRAVVSVDIDFRTVLEVSMPYLGPVAGVYTDWTPLEGRGRLYPEDVDRDDPWQFKNFLVT